MDNAGNWQDSGHFWEEILSTVQHPILVTDMDGTIRLTAATVRETLGYAPEELAGQSISSLFTDEDLGCLYRNLLFLARKGRSFEGEIMLIRKDHVRILANLVMRPSRASGGGPDLIVFSLRDIGKTRRLERNHIQNHYADLVQIANGIAHEIRNPLVGIGGFVNRLYKLCSVVHDHSDYYRYIMQGVTKIDNLIRKVEFFSSIPQPAFRDGNIEALVHEAVLGLAQRVADKGVRLSVDLAGLVLYVDRDLLLRVFEILLENALDAVGDGGEISVSGEICNNQCIVSVRDNGSGIARDDLPFIFNPFFSTKPDGAGIDLAVVKRIMEGHGGSIAVESEPGAGSAFHMRFPLERRRLVRTHLLENLEEFRTRPNGADPLVN